MRAAIAVSVLLALVTTPVSAQTTDGIFSWLTTHGLSIRRTFDGSKNEGQPASLQIVRSRASSDESYYLVDIALKLFEGELLPHTTRSLLVYPTAEWHRSTQDDRVSDVVSIGAKAEIRPFGLRLQPSVDTADTRTGYLIVPTFVLEGRNHWDSKNDTRGTKLSLAVFPTSNVSGYPGSDIRNASGAFRARYYPYLGLEHWHSDSLFGGDRATFATFRLYFEWVPFGSLSKEYLELVADFTRRWRSGGNDLVRRAMSMQTLSATIYPSGTRHFGIGADYSNGQDPARVFASVDRLTVALRVKF